MSMKSNDRRTKWVFAIVLFVLAVGSVLSSNCNLAFARSIIIQATQAPEDSDIPQENLMLWLMASDLKSELGENETIKPLEKWNDRSPFQRKFEQSVPDSRPKIVKLSEDLVVRFDGEDDFLRFAANKPYETRGLTVFVVAAPSSNPGDFRGLIAANAPDGRDYETGFNIDLGPGPGFAFDNLNVEGRGFGGARDLYEGNQPFGRLHFVQLIVDPENKRVQTVVDKEFKGEREYNPNLMSLQELTIGARYFTHGPGSQLPRSPFAGDIAEILVYDRVLSDEEQATVNQYLFDKHQRLQEDLPADFQSRQTGIVLKKIEQPPAVQMLLPGFEVYELPVQLTNVNNVRYRQDGKLLTLGYNGDIHLLSDTDGDGLEDTAELFWKNEGSLRGPIGMAVTPLGYERGDGVFVPSKGKVSLIVDTNRDDKADQEIVVATGWPEIFTNVDASGICLDSENNIYFGLGVADFSNAYQVGEDGIANYSLEGQNGTIQKVSADFSKRETVCTGIRFPIGIALNEHGDVFCTEQEGATWLANGNPLDELLWIQPKRHFGFPPRHPKHNPSVIDEPSVIEFGPQHQSTCGLFFNNPVNGGPVFGDPQWLNDALVCGESRGKIWRTTLAKTENGYLAQKQLLACLQMLTIDACVAPNGDLIVCCHSGPPDWGTGPTGEGKLYRIRSLPTKQRAARPVLAWQQSEQEVRIAFDQPVNPQEYQNSSDESFLHYGRYIQAGDEFETLVPPYVAVHRQLNAPRFKSVIHSMGLTSDRQTMILATDKVASDVKMALSLKTSKTQPNADSTAAIEPIRQTELVNVDIYNNGLLAQINADAEPIWLPHLNLSVSKKFTASSELHRQWFSSLTAADNLSLSTQLNLYHMLRPAIQPGEKIDYQWPAETVTVAFSSDSVFKVSFNGDTKVAKQTDAGFRVQFERSGDDETLVPVTVELQLTDAAALPALDVVFFTNEDSRFRVIPSERFQLPWIKTKAEETIVDAVLPTELEGGSWGRGRQVFHSAAAACFKCHAVDSVGGRIGPDLTNLRHRDYQTVLRDVTKPSFTINPDYVGNTIVLDDGRTLSGILRTIDGQQKIGNPEGDWVSIDASSIEQSAPAKQSIMPEGLLDKLTEQQRKDLFVYLLSLPPSMPLDSPLKAPPLRTKQEVAEVLAGSEEISNPKPLTITLVAGPKDHGPGEHDYPAWQKQWGQLLTAAENVSIELAWEFPDENQLNNSDVLIFFQKGDWNDQRQKRMDDYFQRGGGAVYMHWAVNGNDRAKDFSKRIGMASKAGAVGYRHGPLRLDLHHTDHPIMRNLGSTLQLYDESYWLLAGEESQIQLLASSQEERNSTPQLWTFSPGNGRVFVSIPGHYNWTFDDPVFRVFLLRGVAWTAGEPVDRFNDLVPLGARIQK